MTVTTPEIVTPISKGGGSVTEVGPAYAGGASYLQEKKKVREGPAKVGERAHVQASNFYLTKERNESLREPPTIFSKKKERISPMKESGGRPGFFLSLLVIITLELKRLRLVATRAKKEGILPKVGIVSKKHPCRRGEQKYGKP